MDIPNIRDNPSALGEQWCGLFEEGVDFEASHFEQAMTNLIRHPNINSTVLLRADILSEVSYPLNESEKTEISSTGSLDAKSKPLVDDAVETDDSSRLELNLQDTALKSVPLEIDLAPKIEIVRQIIPRNPNKDPIINQTCLVLGSADGNTSLVIYIPHIDNPHEIPFYLPQVKAIGILFDNSKLSIHYMPFAEDSVKHFQELDPKDRMIRIAFRLLGTARKHSSGVKQGYQKRVNHDLVVSKVAFQDRYIKLKQKYSRKLVDNWSEKTDPRKHVFEDIAIAAFLMEFWDVIYSGKESFEFRDLGCGNGLLVYLLTMEGYNGLGIDARRRKSWKTYPPEVRDKLKEQVVIPSILLRPHPALKSMAPHVNDNGRLFQVPVSIAPSGNSREKQLFNENVPLLACYSSSSLLQSPQVNTAEFPTDTFIIGNHSDELTCWIPLLGYPFMVIPCCSHSLSGARVRYPPGRRVKSREEDNKVQPVSYSSSSTYAALVDHVEDIATSVGWRVEKEMLRIPSTRNAAILGYQVLKDKTNVRSVYDVLVMEGGAEGWVENTMGLMTRPPRQH
ncbi:unnamed protein product [Kuraishia capsulata CBS 1993]|uniref:tRNA (uracil-O(2)-)-methyltransferase n=1 Tax=Kuraishia capsulata CBS 1993 TaxID=1382522 RepID=W6MVZ3_9ASCO|nr:uncharacterized protein KUCA_T00002659001 [Kuraishia capsulata CBS 1993]CDK26685.1 unnamed protein product [Kuraishia capsulata CBS 1993]